MAEQFQAEKQLHEAEKRTLSVNVPDLGYSKIGYVNIRGASLNYVVGKAHNKESAHCAALAD
ncbi:hypothetical protein ABIA99_005970 [Bradyrhizobium sp. LB12.1]|uniref:hypothetical protein n=1 Tax=Bradyrhizobium sp. LB12.1 TaxID=3156327 RepID=UPI0033980B14